MEIKPKHIDVDITKGRYDKRFIFLLISLLTFLFGALLIPSAFTQYLNPLFMIQFAFAGLLLFRNHKRSIYRLVYIMIFLLLVFEGLKMASASSKAVNIIHDTTYIIYFIIMTFEVFRQILLARRVDYNMVAGAFCGFLMLGIMSSFVLSVIAIANPNAFKGINTASFDNTFQDLIYYSFVSILTIGYGDITPVTSTARRASLLIGIFGYFYNIFVIGITIAKFMVQQQEHRNN